MCFGGGEAAGVVCGASLRCFTSLIYLSPFLLNLAAACLAVDAGLFSRCLPVFTYVSYQLVITPSSQAAPLRPAVSCVLLLG